MHTDYAHVLSDIYNEVQDLPDDGEVAAYIPELAAIEPNQFGVHLSTIEGQKHGVGDYEKKFSIQSISKVLSLTLAFQQMGEDIWKRVGVEPSGNPFNSLWQLEYEHGKPRNPLINSGA
ncbi:MAG: glutaminase, partial [Bacteroidota bacterium]|nr:glutaminase [Bacteroidota bacterium]